SSSERITSSAIAPRGHPTRRVVRAVTSTRTPVAADISIANRSVYVGRSAASSRGSVRGTRERGGYQDRYGAEPIEPSSRAPAYWWNSRRSPFHREPAGLAAKRTVTTISVSVRPTAAINAGLNVPRRVPPSDSTPPIERAI